MQAIAPYGIFTTDAELRVRSWNQWLVTHSGIAEAQIIGRRLTDFYPDLEDRRLLARFDRALAGEISVMSTALHRHLLPFEPTAAHPGQPYMLQTARIAPLPGPKGIAGTITIIEDVSQREGQAAALRRQQELDRLLSDALGALLQAADSAHDIGRIFTPLLPSFGLDAYFCYLWQPATGDFRLHAVAGIAPRQREQLATVALSPDDPVNSKGQPLEVNATLAGHAATMERLGLQSRLTLPLTIGTRVIGFMAFGSYEGSPVSFADTSLLGRVTHFLAIAIDRAAKEREAIAAATAKDDFLAALSHELRTPLNPVLLVASDSANDPEMPAAARQAFRTIEKNALLEARLIDDLLDLTRIEHGKLRLDLQALDAHSVVRDALANVRADAQEKRIELAIDLAARRSEVRGDPARLQQIFWNVLKNGIKFTPVGGRLTVNSRLDEVGSEWSLEVIDTGIGMEPHELRNVFNAFAQGDHARGQGSHHFGGLGLGLAICQKLVEMHDGRIEASSEGRGRGSRFRVHFPLAEVKGAAEGGFVAFPYPLPADATPAKRILLVEDHAPTRGPLVTILNRRGYEVIAVGSAVDALQQASRYPFDLVLSDIGLPDMDGYALMRQLKGLYRIPGIALTGYGMETDVAQSVDAGFVAHLTKPIHVQALERTVRTVLSSRQ
jgi:signal transduction histidine kinase